MAVRRKQQRAQRVVSTPHPPRSKRHTAADNSEISDLLSPNPGLGSSGTGKPQKASRTRHTGDTLPGKNEPRAKRKRCAEEGENYAEALAKAGFRYPSLSTSEPAHTVHNNRPDAPTLPPVARKRPLTIEEARKLTKDDPPVRVYADGVFDLFHVGHARLLMQAKQSFANVCVVSGIPSDEVVKELKGNTVQTAEERLAMMQHSRYVDEVIEDAPFTPTLEFLERHKIDFVAHDDKPLAVPGKKDIYGEVKEAGRFLGTHRTEGISTSGVIARIVRNYDTYVCRNLSRGYPREDLGLSYVKEQRIRARGHVNDIMHTWKGSRRMLIGGFIRLFGPMTAPLSSLFSSMGSTVPALAASASGSGSPSGGAGGASAPSTNAASSSAGRFDDFFDDAFDDEEQEEDMARPWFKETTEFVLSESESGEDNDDDQTH